MNLLSLPHGKLHCHRPNYKSLCSSLPIQSLSICIERGPGELALPDDLFGGKAPIHHLQFIAKCSCHIIAPGCLLCDVTHFTTKMSLSYSALLNQLYLMSSLTHLEYWQPPELLWSYLHMPADTLPTSPIQMPQLMNVEHARKCVRKFRVTEREVDRIGS